MRTFPDILIDNMTKNIEHLTLQERFNMLPDRTLLLYRDYSDNQHWQLGRKEGKLNKKQAELCVVPVGNWFLKHLPFNFSLSNHQVIQYSQEAKKVSHLAKELNLPVTPSMNGWGAGIGAKMDNKWFHPSLYYTKKELVKRRKSMPKFWTIKSLKSILSNGGIITLDKSVSKIYSDDGKATLLTRRRIVSREVPFIKKIILDTSYGKPYYNSLILKTCGGYLFSKDIGEAILSFSLENGVGKEIEISQFVKNETTIKKKYFIIPENVKKLIHQNSCSSRLVERGLGYVAINNYSLVLDKNNIPDCDFFEADLGYGGYTTPIFSDKLYQNLKRNGLIKTIPFVKCDIN